MDPVSLNTNSTNVDIVSPHRIALPQSPVHIPSDFDSQHTGDEVQAYPPSPTHSSSHPALPLVLGDDPTDIRCWVCYSDYSETPNLRWVRPCKCKGSLGYTHESCLLRFISTQDVSSQPPHCPQCNTPYTIISKVNRILALLNHVDHCIAVSVPYLLIGGTGLCFLFISTTYGVYALMSVCGSDAEVWLSDPNWGWRVWAGLPLILPVLILSRTDLLDNVLPLVPLWLLDFKDISNHVSFSSSEFPLMSVLKWWPPSPATTMVVLPWLRFAWNAIYRNMTEATLVPILLKSPAYNRIDDAGSADQARLDVRLSERTELGRMIVGATLVPVITSSVGLFLAKYIPSFKLLAPSYFLRTVIGGCAFIVTKDLFYLYYRRQSLLADYHKHVANHESH